ncbi:hypothetical protein FD09_GL001032 [Schleiferilactobacillus perolens DSM 12744]|uniref:Uncharacterized protein n=2 Tax=Schleiferilactobacillus perolens TaxID=100468 RepID=A0A0R1MXQ9_9LACO|nr:hypothetical protein FD09_GL001032 [Schleiferilactobacillus perolens DSM 12744]
MGLLFAMTRRKTFQLVQAAISGFLLVAVTIDLLRGPGTWGGVGGILLQLFLIVSLLQAYDDRRRNPTGYQRPPVGSRLLPLLVAQGYYPFYRIPDRCRMECCRCDISSGEHSADVLCLS